VHLFIFSGCYDDDKSGLMVILPAAVTFRGLTHLELDINFGNIRKYSSYKTSTSMIRWQYNFVVLFLALTIFTTGAATASEGGIVLTELCPFVDTCVCLVINRDMVKSSNEFEKWLHSDVLWRAGSNVCNVPGTDCDSRKLECCYIVRKCVRV